ncbi:hypothetical protein [Actinosynnema sp. NPDC023587]|uniref:hypothetical protein n=1 Tax=Actinosynnema sp. NPDC023587 TaxID=3154695 RepID=UPI0033F0248F
MTAYVAEPVVVLPANRVETAGIVADVRAHHPDHPRLPVALRVIRGAGVETRYFTRPFAEAVADRGVTRRVADAFGDALAMAAEAARGALRSTGTAAHEVDAVITSHTTSWAVPQLDVHLVDALGLRPDVARIPMATLACAGGAQALVRAAEHLRANPGATVLVVVAEVLSTIYHRREGTIESMIYKALFGDSAGACVVTGEPVGPGFAIESTVEFVLPDSLERYRGRLDESGLHFDSTKEALTAARDVLPHLLATLGDWRPSFAVLHPGGPRVITETAAGLGLRPEDARHSTASLAENGNLGGNAVLDVLRRTHADPPAHRSEGLVLGFGPGFVVAGARGRWV